MVLLHGFILIVLRCRYSPFLVACYNPDTEEFQSVCRVMSGFADSFYTEVSMIVACLHVYYVRAGLMFDEPKLHVAVYHYIYFVV